MGAEPTPDEPSQREPEVNGNPLKVLQQMAVEILAARKIRQDNLSMVAHTRSVISERGPQLSAASAKYFASLQIWLSEGPAWRQILAGLVGTIGVTLAGGLATFSIVLAITVLNAVLVAGVLTLWAFATFLIIILATVSTTAVGAAVIAAVIISWVTFCTIFFLVCTAGALLGTWVTWKVVAWAARGALTIFKAATGATLSHKYPQNISENATPFLRSKEFEAGSSLESGHTLHSLKSDAESEPKLNGTSGHEAS